MGAQGVVAKPEDDAMSYEKTYEQMFQSCNMSDEDFRALSKQHFEFAIKRADGKESDDDVPSIMPWLEVYYVTVEDETGVLVPFWEGFFARFMPLAKELIKKAKEKENPNG
jgi:hypothetical protein